MFLGNNFSFEAELYGFTIAVELEYKFRWYPLWIETDSIYLVLLFRNDSNKDLWRFISKWARALHAKELNVKVSHIFREENCVADKLASISTSSEETKVVPSSR